MYLWFDVMLGLEMGELHADGEVVKVDEVDE